MLFVPIRLRVDSYDNGCQVFIGIAVLHRRCSTPAPIAINIIGVVIIRIIDTVVHRTRREGS
jgi:hypothetical protein